ncbi:MAG: 23S rRNA (uracil(1939)-C(5))-methyltransferase RlmD, partial [Bulleidia sp.]|nr:23S rRNA (uracil(1939)-C(5))-methyltransferase RlmD [Bulleidia sp.]
TFVKELLEKEPRISSIVLNYNRKDTSLILGDTDKVLYGPGYITDTIHDIEFRISPKSFYQINPVQTEKLYSIAIELANLKKTDNVLDACCGIGTISLCAAKSVNSVTGVEISKDAIKDAIYNAKKNHINNAYFYTDDAGEFIDSLIDKPDVVFLDPPRSGMSKQAIDALIRLKTSRIVYISCNPETQARDVKQLVKEGYRISKIVPVDLFPYTKHVETVVLLQRMKV